MMYGALYKLVWSSGEWNEVGIADQAAGARQRLGLLGGGWVTTRESKATIFYETSKITLRGNATCIGRTIWSGVAG